MFIFCHTQKYFKIFYQCWTSSWKYDGTGYPGKLAGENIPYLARIASIADSFDAMTSKRTYRNALDIEVVKSEIERCSGTQFDPQIAKVFLDILNNDYDKIYLLLIG